MAQNHVTSNEKLVLFLPINAAGHINTSVAIADRLRADHNYKTVFLIVGPSPSDEISSHGHELIQLEDSDPFDDYEIEDHEDTSKPVDEARMLELGRKKRRFVGAAKYAQITARFRHLFEGSPSDIYKERAAIVGRFLVPGLRASNALVEQQIGRLNPKLIVCDLYFPPPRVLLEEHARPWVRLHTANPLVLTQPKRGTSLPQLKPTSRIYTKLKREQIRREQPQEWAKMVGEWRALAAQIAQTNVQNYESMRKFYQANGCNHLNPDMPAVDSPHLNMYLFPKALDYDQDDDLLEYPANWIGCDSLMRHQASASNGAAAKQEAELERWTSVLAERQRERPNLKLIFFSIGSISSADLKKMRRFMAMLAADSNPDHLYVVSKGQNGDKIELNERNMIGANYLPQLFFLARAHLAIIHGGNNTVTECLYFGVPSIVLPCVGDQFDNAWRVQDMQLGRALNVNECTREQLLGAVNELLADQQVRDKARQVGEEMRARDELIKMSDVLSDLVELGRLSEEKVKKYGIKA